MARDEFDKKSTVNTTARFPSWSGTSLNVVSPAAPRMAQ